MNWKLLYRSESLDCTGEWSGHYDSMENALKDLTLKAVASAKDAEILGIFATSAIRAEFA